MFSKIARSFSTKKGPFFWQEINKNVLAAQYAVRGVVPTLATTMQNQIANGKKYPFDKITFCNIGNPQQFKQKPISFNRQVLACVLNPELISNPTINKDAAKRAKLYLDQIISAGSYTHSLGIPLVRKTIANYIKKQDNVQAPSIQDIFLTQGASQGVHLLLNTMITSQNDAIMIPIPQYPLYSAAISLYGGSPAPYYLNQEKGWQLDLNELQRSIVQSKKNGKKVKAIVIINPGNPTGAIFNQKSIEQIIQFSVKHKLVLISDQVYRQNIYKQNTVFVSARKVLNKMKPQIQQACQLASLHSVSKGLLGQCGLRGGYLNIYNFNPAVKQQLVKLKSINLCSNSIGQMMVDLMCNPPVEGVQDQTKKKYLQEHSNLLKSLKKRAKLVTQFLNSMTNVTSNQVQGAMYAFPQIKFSQKAIEAAKAEGKVVDLFYCLQVLKNTGIALVPGSGFRQKQGTYHFRITTLILPQEQLKSRLQDLKKFNDQFHAKYMSNL